MNFLGIDIGTSGCKAVVFDEHGRAHAAAHRDYAVTFTEDGGAQLDSDAVISNCFTVIQECAELVEPGSVQSLCISSQGEAFTAVGSHGKILSQAMVSSDARAKTFVGPWTEQIGLDRLYHITGHTARPIFTLFKLLWMRDARPEVWQQAQYFLCFEDLLIYKLGLPPTISWSLAGRTMLFDVRKGTWSGEILEQIGLEPERLARPLPSGSIAGELTKESASRLGLSPGTVVVTGGHDQGCSALGAGVTDDHTAMLGSGTVECLTAVMPQPILSEHLREHNLCTYHYTIPDRYTTLAYSLTGGNLLQWFQEEFGTAERQQAEATGQDVYEILLNTLGNTPAQPLALPYFTPSGTPYFDYQTKGALVGLRLSTDRHEILRALLEGVAFEMRLNLELLQAAGYKVHTLRNVGGGSQSDVLVQVRADVMGVPIETLHVTEAGCLGAAMLGCAIVTNTPVEELAAKWVLPGETFTPNPDYQVWYTERFDQYKELYRSIQGLKV